MAADLAEAPRVDDPRADRFADLLRQVLAGNPFYREKYRALASEHGPGWAPSLADLPLLPFTTKTELVEDQARNPPFGSNLTFPLERYTRFHRTSGTTGRPLPCLDTRESWSWWLDCWEEIYRAAGVTPADRVFLPFSFGPFIGFWSAFEAAQRLGALTVPGGGLSSTQRLDLLRECEATVVVCTPTYALHLAEVARQAGIDLAASPVRVTIHAGEPGASVPNVRARIEEAWGARAVDHVGATEVGAWGYGCGVESHVHLIESEFIAELIPQASAATEPGATREAGAPALPMAGAQGRSGELVLTNLGRAGSPAIRYRTGDVVEVGEGACPCGRPTAYLPGGVLGRVDGMVCVRGVNVFPSAIEDIVRGFVEVAEFELEVDACRDLPQLVVRIELGGGDGARAAPDGVAGALADEIRRRLTLWPRIEVAPPGSLPRYELKARRFKGA